MRWSTLAMVCLVAGAAAFGLARTAAAAGTVVHVQLWDSGPDSMSMLGNGPKMGMGMDMDMHANMSMAKLGLRVDKTSVPAGDVTFEVVNTSKDMIHEMIVAPIQDSNTALPYDAQTERVDEDAAGHLGEVSELDPGKSGALRLTLSPGQYILLCNIPGHYVLGMWTLLTVTQ